MSIQYATYNDSNMESGKFYFIEANKDNASNLREVNSFVGSVASNTQAIAQLQQTVQGIEQNETKIIDNTRRINNLEDRDLKHELLYALDQSSIVKTFVNATRVEIQHNRKEIYVKKVMAYVGTAENEEMYEDITHSVKLLEAIVRNPQGIIVSKKVIIQSENPITGYILIV